MAHTSERTDSGQEGESLRLLAPAAPPVRRLPSVSGRLAAALGVLLLGGLIAVYRAEELTLLPGTLVAGAALALAAVWQPLRQRRIASAVLLANVALVLAYFWSLDETHHVVVTVTPGALWATVDGDSTVLQARPRGTSFGFQASPTPSYRIQATGEAIQSDTQSVMGRVAAAVRLAQPASAWTNIRVETLDGRQLRLIAFRAENPAGSWQINRRGEWQGDPGSYVLFSPGGVRSYRVSVDVRRPDGSQSLLLGVNGANAGYALQLRFDQPDALWVRWRDGEVVTGAGGTGLHHLNFVAELQRVVRTLLSGYLFALLLAALAVGLYPILFAFFRITGESSDEEWRPAQRLLEAHRFNWIFAGLVAGAGVVATGLVSTYLLHRMPHVQDSVAYLFQAKIFASGAFHVRAPPAPIQSFFAEQFVPFYHGTWLSQYPPGHPLMLFIGVLLGAPWLVEPVLASLALGLVYFLGRRVYGNGVGLVAALLGLSSPFWLFLGSSFMAHATGLFFVAAFMLAFARMEDDDAVRWPLLAGFFAGMAIITRELTAIGVLGPFAAYAVLFQPRSWRRYLPAVAGAAVPLGFLLIYQWAQMGNPLQTTYAAWDPRFLFGFGEKASPIGAFTPAGGLSNTWQNLAMLSAQLYGWPFGVALAFAFLPFVLGAAKKWDYLLASSFLGLVAAHVFYWASGLMYGPRYYYEALPALLLLTSRGIFELARLPLRLWPRFGVRTDGTLGAFFPAMLVFALLLFNLRFYLPAQLPLYNNYNYSSNAELQAVARAHLHHAIVFVVSEPQGFWASYGNVFFTNDPLLRGDIIYAHDEGLLDGQLYPYFPGRAHYRLDGTTLTRLS